jgi:hypothetical protein
VDADSPTFDIPSMLVTTDDGVVFECAPVNFSGANAPYPPGLRLRWQLTRMTPRPSGDDSPTQYIGPPIQPDRSTAAVRALVNEWWTRKQELGQV